jgi:hypothetical protein
MLQMAFPNLRSDNSLIAFNRRLQELGWDLKVGGQRETVYTYTSVGYTYGIVV